MGISSRSREIVLPPLLAVVQLLLEYRVLGARAQLQDDLSWHYNL